MQLRFLARKTHKWLSLIVGIQVLLWIVSGLYMTAVDIDLVHGDHLVNPITAPTLADKIIAPLPAKAFGRYGDVSEVKLTTRMGKAVYLLNTAEGKITLDAQTGAIVEELQQNEVSALAKAYYAGEGNVVQIRRLDQYPQELGGRDLPVWQVHYDDWLNSTLYFDVNNGRLIRKRSDLWRWFDLLWMLHIMDYESREDINNNLLRLAASLGLLMSVSGLLMLWYRLRAKGGKS